MHGIFNVRIGCLSLRFHWLDLHFNCEVNLHDAGFLLRTVIIGTLVLGFYGFITFTPFKMKHHFIN